MSNNKFCKKVSDTRCTPHEGPMSPDCELSPKNRCIAKKTKTKTKSKAKAKSKADTSPKSCKKVSETRCSP